jgi:hypothetical protein
MDQIHERSKLVILAINIFWQEHYYKTKGIDDANPQKPVLMKPLGRLFMAFPHASIMNTLLIDDLPMKNALNHLNQAIHPPPYIGDNIDIGFGLDELEQWLKDFHDSLESV